MRSRLLLIIFGLLIINLIINQPTSAIDPRFHTYGEMSDEIRYVSLRYPNITRIYTIGYTTAFHLPILAMRISDNPQINEDEPKLLYNGIHHACELIGPEVCLYLINDLVTKYGNDSFITSTINNTEIWIVPMVNPDGNYIVESGIDTFWRKNCRDNNGNGIWDPEDGVDLNRNYDFLWELGGSPDPNSREYRGPYPFSENETQAIRDLVLSKKFVFDICYHSSKEQWEGEAVYYPWRWGNPFCPDYNYVRAVAESVAYRIQNDAGTGTYYAIAGRATEGGLSRNWMYFATGTFAYTIEVSHTYFPPAYRVDSICQRNLAGAYYLLQRSFGSQITGHVTDSITGQPLVAEVRILQAYAPPESMAPRTSDTTYGRFYRILNPGSYTVKVVKLGYETESIPNVVVSAGLPTILEIKLSPTHIFEDKTIPINQNKTFQILPSITNNNNKINFVLNGDSKVNIDIYSQNGRLINTLVNQTLPTGVYSYSWNYEDKNGKKVNDGVYFIKIRTSQFEQTKKLIVAN